MLKRTTKFIKGSRDLSMTSITGRINNEYDIDLSWYHGNTISGDQQLPFLVVKKEKTIVFRGDVPQSKWRWFPPNSDEILISWLEEIIESKQKG